MVSTPRTFILLFTRGEARECREIVSPLWTMEKILEPPLREQKRRAAPPYGLEEKESRRKTRRVSKICEMSKEQSPTLTSLCKEKD